MEKVKIGIIGTGGISHIHVQQLSKLNYVEITAVVDPDKKNRDIIISKFQLEDVKEYSDHREMLKEIELTAIVICSLHTLHFNQAMDSLKHGCHVLIEKPMACSEEGAQKLIDTANNYNKVLQVSYQRHFEPEFLFIKDTISNGEIGKLTSVTASLYQDWKHLTEGTWRQDPLLSGGGMLMDSGSHIIDVLLWTTGLSVTEVSTQIETHNSNVELDSFTSLRFDQDVLVGLNIIGYAPCWHETYVFCGETGGIFYENGKITIRRLGGVVETPDLPAKETNQDKSFIDAILGKHEALVPGYFAKEVVKLTEAIYQSAGYSPRKNK
ncbi:Gfo/Idh/MocA family protein [Aquibacillus salsiterrae]|uniref:Gfo/Idh/MocA family oxidoreductase n=1 Tax=Aquibacillus salsiterrae TaxID=2950439 RepID=A0A9X4AED0_9BACI|nr:Gfo/Idh/MocA family oxidoreductase [Aquibacillus salsiterrae]MDC3416621.1 Gfo/Idh/MocA family oxidoreductase [Aquibacillus salsiterrae]